MTYKIIIRAYDTNFSWLIIGCLIISVTYHIKIFLVWFIELKEFFLLSFLEVLYVKTELSCFCFFYSKTASCGGVIKTASLYNHVKISCDSEIFVMMKWNLFLMHSMENSDAIIWWKMNCRQCFSSLRPRGIAEVIFGWLYFNLRYLFSPKASPVLK